ncbi:hypothetical protein D918_05868 [Trichuris suis]|nr:hypothetical protein D918_05868 [Trichuris suis]
MDNVRRRRHRYEKDAEKWGIAEETKRTPSAHRERRDLVNSQKNGERCFSLRNAVVVLLAISVGVLHRYYLAMLFENDRHFSHLGEMEREMSFRSEMGFYYSFYKNLVDSPTFVHGIRGLLRDNRTEFGHEINDLKRFNLYPEIVAAVLFRTYQSLTRYFDYETEVCWSTFRGENISPTTSCEGMGNKFYFYLNIIFSLGGLLASLLFLFGYLLSESILGGILTILCFFFNHGQATRTMWAPCLRESFGYPIFLLLMLVVTAIVKANHVTSFRTVLVAFCSCTFMLFWQFASFPLSTMVVSLLLLNLFGYLSTKVFAKILSALMVGFLAAVVLLFFNEMLLTSFYATSLFVSFFTLLTERVFSKRSLLGAIAKILLFGVGTVALKVLIARLCSVTDDAHIFELLKSKLLGEYTFHTYLYLCMIEFGFLPTNDIIEMSRSLLLPASMIVLLAALKVFITSTLITGKGSTRWPIRAYAAVYYTCIQLSCFLVMAGLVMRLKLFFTPHMCIICSLVFNPTFLSDVFGRPVSWRRSVILGVLLAILMSIFGVTHVQKQLSIKGEFSDMRQEELLLWIKKNTSPDAVFAGQMPIMSSIMLSTGRPIVAHPHYEDAALRKRVKTIYQMFSRKPVQQFHKAVASTGAHYLIIERNYCYNADAGTVTKQCYFPNAWDNEDPNNLGNDVCCWVMQMKPAPFKRVYESGVYIIFKV